MCAHRLHTAIRRKATVWNTSRGRSKCAWPRPITSSTGRSNWAPSSGLHLDTGHAALTGLDLSGEVSAAGKRLLSTHIASNDGLTDKHWLPTTGVVDWASTKRGLDDGGYAERYVFEVLGGSDPDEVLRQAVDLASAS